MTTLENRPRTALLVVDVQNGNTTGAHERDKVVANVVELVRRARQADVPVVWVQHGDDNLVRGSDPWRTDLEEVLAGLRVGRLVVAGAQTDECIRATLHGAVVRGYDATLVSDAHTTEDLSEWGAPPPDKVIAHTNLYWSSHAAPGRTAGTVATADVDFGIREERPSSDVDTG
jgi:nicotinamidase-related amidase